MLSGMSMRPRAGDPARAGIVLAAVVWAVLDSPRDALALVLVVPPAFALRTLAVPQWLDGALCAALLTAQLGAEAGLTERTEWWDAGMHVVTGALVAALALRVASPRPVVAIAVVAVLGVAWESVEWACDATLGTDFAPSRGDTLSDLGMDMAGAVLAVLAVLARPRHQSREPQPVGTSPFITGGHGGSPETTRPTAGRSPAA
jgi:hypothetical protein